MDSRGLDFRCLLESLEQCRHSVVKHLLKAVDILPGNQIALRRQSHDLTEGQGWRLGNVLLAHFCQAAGPRQALRDALGCLDLDWERGQAWAFQQAMGLVWYYKDTNPVMSRLGRTTLDRLLTGR